MRITTSTDIQAPVEKVWSILKDFDSYPEWNPLTVKVRGELKVDEVVKLHVQLGGQRMVRKHIISRVVENEALCWTIRSKQPWLMRGERCQRLTALEDGGCRYENDERVEGLSSILVSLFFAGKIKSALEAVGDKLKERAESP